METKDPDQPGTEPKFTLRIIISGRAYGELERLSKDYRRSMIDTLRMCIGYAKAALQVYRLNQRIVITTAQGLPVKEVHIPEP